MGRIRGRRLRPLGFSVTVALEGFQVFKISLSGGARVALAAAALALGAAPALAHERSDRLTVVVLGNLNGGAPDKLGADLMTLARGGTVTLNDERQAVAVSPDVLRAYVGVYEASPTFAITMSVVDGRLMTQATGQETFELFAEGPDAFFLTVVDAQVVFTRDASGAVDGMVLHQGGRELRVRKK